MRTGPVGVVRGDLGDGHKIYPVNDGESPDYPQATPKQRVPCLLARPELRRRAPHPRFDAAARCRPWRPRRLLSNQATEKEMDQ